MLTCPTPDNQRESDLNSELPSPQLNLRRHPGWFTDRRLPSKSQEHDCRIWTSCSLPSRRGIESKNSRVTFLTSPSYGFGVSSGQITSTTRSVATKGWRKPPAASRRRARVSREQRSPRPLRSRHRLWKILPWDSPGVRSRTCVEL